MKKPVVMETYDEIVFPEPSIDFFARARKHPALIVPKLPATYNLPAGIAFYISICVLAIVYSFLYLCASIC